MQVEASWTYMFGECHCYSTLACLKDDKVDFLKSSRVNLRSTHLVFKAFISSLVFTASKSNYQNKSYEQLNQTAFNSALWKYHSLLLHVLLLCLLTIFFHFARGRHSNREFDCLQIYEIRLSRNSKITHFRPSQRFKSRFSLK